MEFDSVVVVLLDCVAPKDWLPKLGGNIAAPGDGNGSWTL